MKRADAFESRRRARRRALQALYQWEITHQNAEEILAQFKAQGDYRGVDLELFDRLVGGVIAQTGSLDELLNRFTDRPMDQIDLMERVVLRMGAFELVHSPEVPYRVLLNEAVDLSKRFGSANGHAYVNGVLDRAAHTLRPDEAGAEACRRSG